MGLSRRNNGRAGAGFTLAEVLTVVAILVILAAIAVPGIVTLQSSLKFAELNDTARVLYSAAQNQLVELRSAGRLDELGGTPIADMPSDYRNTATNPDWATVGGSFRVLTDADAGGALLLPPDTLDEVVAGNHYAVEYNAATGMVYAVFYAEETIPYSPALLRDADSREAGDPMLGYYGGSATQTSTPDTVAAANARLVNDDESLRLVLTELTEGLTYEIAVSQAGDPAQVWTQTIAPTYVTGLSYTLILDSPETGRFAQTCPGLTPGADLSITITARKEGALPAVTCVTGNSLFASRAGNTVYVSCGRHLQNLSAALSGVEAGVTAAVQTGDIPWNSTRHGAFTPIENAALTSYDGGGQVISDLAIRADTGSAGLFATLSAYPGRATLRGVRLADPVVTSAGDQPAGTLVGTATQVDLSNCQVYATAGHYATAGLTSETGTGILGGLVGTATDCTFTGCAASLPTVTSELSSAGGLVGAAQGCSFTGCYANTGYAQEPDSAKWANGLSGAGTAGGFLALGAGNTFVNCYSMGFLWGGNAAGGFLGAEDGETANTFTRCYSAAILSERCTSAYPFAAAGTINDCYSLKGCGATQTDRATALAYTALRFALYDDNNGVWSSATADTTHPYGRTDALPFPRLAALEHYGDWPLPTEDALLGYYERYADGSYGWYLTADTDILLSSLSDAKTVTADGYAFLVTADEAEDTIEVTYSGGTVTLAKGETVALEDGDYAAYLLAPNSPALTSSTQASGLWHKLSVEGQDFWFIPDVAKAAVNGSSAAPAAPSTLLLRTARQLYQVGLAGSRYTATSFRQERDIDVGDYTGLDIPALSPIGGNTYGGGYDGGGHTITTDVGVSAVGGQAGLFSTIVYGGSVKNLTFRADPACTTAPVISADTNAGGLVGALYAGEVENCAVSGFAIQAKEGYGGGLVGYAAYGSDISGCSAVHYGAPGNAGVFGRAGVGGLLGSSDAGGAISRCYAIATISSESDSRWGGLAGSSGEGDSFTDCYAIAFTTDGAPITARVGDDRGARIQSCYAASPDEATGNGDSVLSYEELAALDLTGFSTTSAANSHPYASSLAGNAYPFPAIVKQGSSTVHYGDWPVQTLRTAHLAYYEVYQDGSKNYSLGFQCEELGLDTLTDSKTIVLDGYAVLLEGSGDVAAARYNETKSLISLSSLASVLGKSKLTLEGSGNSGNVASDNGAISFKDVGTYYAGVLNYATVVDSAAVSGYWHTLTVTLDGATREFTYNPHFARSQVYIDATPTDLPDTSYIRTERHLATLAWRSAYWGLGLSFTQERDLVIGPKASSSPYLSKYPGLSATLDSHYRYPTKFIGNGNLSFTGVYDGGGKTLTGWAYSVSSETTGAGLFGCVRNATLKNLTLTDFSVTTSTAILHQAGALVGSATGCTLENITVTDSTVKARAIAGGVAGFLDGGMVTNITVRECEISAARLVGGIIGQVVNAAAGVNLNSLAVEDSEVTSFMDSKLLPAYPTTNTHWTYGTGGVIGAAVLRGRAGNAVTLNGITVSGTALDVEELTSGDAYYYAGGMVVGNVCQSGGSFSLQNVTLSSGSKLTGEGGGTNAWYGGLIGLLQGSGTVSLSGTASMSGLSMKLDSDTTNASLGGFLGSILPAEGNTLTLNLPSGSTWVGIELVANGSNTRTGGFVGQTGAGTVLSGGSSGFTLAQASQIKGDTGSTGGFAGSFTGSVSQVAVRLTANVTVQSSGGGNIGGFAGAFSGSADHCHAISSALVQVPSTHNTSYVGGFAGTLSGNVTSCFAAVNVLRGEYIGGFAGTIADAAVVQCYSSGLVTNNSSESGYRTGGFTGHAANSTFQSCYASGDVENSGYPEYSGGFVGEMRDGWIRTCYSSGTVEVNWAYHLLQRHRFGGFIGEITSGSTATVFPNAGIQAVYRYVNWVGSANNYMNDVEQHSGSVTRWTDSQFTQSNVTTYLPDMKLISDYKFPTLPGVGCGVGANVYQHVEPLS